MMMVVLMMMMIMVIIMMMLTTTKLYINQIEKYGRLDSLFVCAFGGGSYCL